MNRIKQPSTWAAFAVLFQLAKAFIPAVYHPVIDGVSTAAAGLGVALNESPAVK